MAIMIGHRFHSCTVLQCTFSQNLAYAFVCHYQSMLVPICSVSIIIAAGIFSILARPGALHILVIWGHEMNSHCVKTVEMGKHMCILTPLQLS